MITFYWYPKCSTCKKAKQWLDENDVAYNQVDMIETPPKKEELQKWFKNSDLGIRRFFNTSGILYREMGLKDKVDQMTDNEAFTLLATDGKLIKRPIVTDGKKVTLGFKESEFVESWK
ncbi:arsenate reductase family protein [Listeria sp. FSL L7-1582]|uniref:arsenate reductase family protein n=1 Tax=Listeria portnoyi TaxID=2713504 RepID=UPI00164E5C9C|nr:arsenate reductase family protein [Listeria portnoyi]MBC6310592.1 arsenate reductase family protein [Listeria portnoyi]